MIDDNGADQVMFPEAGGTMTWQECTLLIATHMLPLGADEREHEWQALREMYVRVLQNHGYSEDAIAANLRNMLARTAECVAILERSGGIIGTA
jgi:hypothetical protein